MQRILTNNNFLTFAQQVAAPSEPHEYNAEAVKRLMKYLAPYVVDVKGIRFKHKAKNKIELINFSTPEEKRAYDNAWEDYQKALALLENRDVPGGRFMILVQFLKFRQAAELIRAPYLARRMYDIVNKKGKSAVCALNFRETIAKITTILVRDYGVPRSEVSLIWGGMQTKPRKRLSKEKVEQMRELFTDEDMEFLKDLGILEESETQVEALEAEIAKEEANAKTYNELKLGTQSKIQRQAEIDKFQEDKSKYCLFTFKAGGVGLSLHQELPNRRARETLIAPTYSAIELVQGLGRTARFTSCSDTDQTMVFYSGTIEVRVAQTVSMKLRCLKEVVRQRESWEAVILGEKPPPEEDEPIKDDGKTAVVTIDTGDDDTLVGGGDEEELEEKEIVT